MTWKFLGRSFILSNTVYVKLPAKEGIRGSFLLGVWGWGRQQILTCMYEHLQNSTPILWGPMEENTHSPHTSGQTDLSQVIYELLTEKLMLNLSDDLTTNTKRFRFHRNHKVGYKDISNCVSWLSFLLYYFNWFQKILWGNRKEINYGYWQKFREIKQRRGLQVVVTPHCKLQPWWGTQGNSE